MLRLVNGHQHILPLLSLILIALLSGCSSSRISIPEDAKKHESMYESGSLSERYYTSADQPNQRIGPYRKWHESGSHAIKGNYKNGLKHGSWYYYLDNGKKEKTVIFQDGEPTRTILPSPHDHDPFRHHHHHHGIHHIPYHLHH